MKKRYNKVTEDKTKRPKYTDGEITLSAIGWKLWAIKRGLVAENSLSGKFGKFIIYSATSNTTIKVLKRVNEN